MLIPTRSGKWIEPTNPQPDDFELEDIAYALARLPRYAGQVDYSVASHSLTLASLVSPENALAALLHDAAEAYLGEIPRSVKHLAPELVALEDSFLRVILGTFGIWSIPDEVISLDASLGEAELTYFFDPHSLTEPSMAQAIAQFYGGPEWVESMFIKQVKEHL